MAIGKLIYDSAKNRNIPTEYASVSGEQREDAIRQEIFKALGVTEYEKKSFRKAMRRNSALVYEIWEEVVDEILKNGDYQKNSFYNQFVELKNLALGDENEFVVKGETPLQVHEFSGSHWDLVRRRVDSGQKFSVEMRDFGIKVYEYFERVASGRVDFATIIAETSKAIEDKMANLAQTTFALALTNLPETFRPVAGTYDEEAITTLSAHVEASNGTKPVIVGTAVALAKLQGKTDVALYSDGMKDSKNQIGYLTTWNAHRCVEIAQGHKAGTFEFTMPNDEVYLISGDTKLVKICLEGDTEVKEIADGVTNADRSVEQVIAFKAGASVAYGGMIGVVKFA